MDDAFVPVGRVGRPHGLDGAFVVERGSDDESRFAIGSVLHVDGVPAKVTLSRRVGGGRRAIRLDRAVERGATLTIPRADLPLLGDGEYYTFEIIGLTVRESDSAGEGRTLGIVKDVLPGSANDNLELDDGTLVPMIEDAIHAVDVEAGVVLLNPGFMT